MEAKITISYINKIVEAGLKPQMISVIVAYNLQVSILKKMLSSINLKIDIHSLDSFQGRENELIIVSFIRSNKQGNCGFVTDQKRLNVAITRAKRQLVVIADAKNFRNDELLSSFFKHFKNIVNDSKMINGKNMFILFIIFSKATLKICMRNSAL